MSSGKGDTKSTYFQLLSNEILRLLFHLTFSGHLTFGSNAKLTQVLVPAHPLNPAIKYVFRRLQICGETSHVLRCYMSKRFEDSSDLLVIGRTATMDQVKAVVLAMKDSVSALEFESLQRITQDIQEVCKLVTTLCKNITTLRITGERLLIKEKEKAHEVFGNILDAFASKITSLTCPFLCEYVSASNSLRYERLRLKRLSLTVKNSDLRIFAALVAKCGGELERLALNLKEVEKRQWKDLFKLIRSECPKLTVLYLNSLMLYDASEEDYVAFLMSYGNQIVSIARQEFSPDALRKLCKACPNLRLDFTIEEDDEGEVDWDCLEAAGEIAGTVDIELRSHHNFRCVSKILANCPNLVNLNMNCISDEPVLGLESVISSPMLELKKLDVVNLTFHACVNTVMKCASKLKELHIAAVDIIETAEPLQSIATTALYLEFVWIQDGSEEWNPRAYPSKRARTEDTTVYIDIVRCFLGCEHCVIFT